MYQLGLVGFGWVQWSKYGLVFRVRVTDIKVTFKCRLVLIFLKSTVIHSVCVCTIRNNYITAMYCAHPSTIAGESNVQCLLPWWQTPHTRFSSNSAGGQWQNCTTCIYLAAYPQSVQLTNFTGSCQQSNIYIYEQHFT